MITVSFSIDGESENTQTYYEEIRQLYYRVSIVYRFIYNIYQSIKIVQKILEVEWEDCLLILHHIPDKCSQCIVLMTIYLGQIACKLIHG